MTDTVDKVFSSDRDETSIQKQRLRRNDESRLARFGLLNCVAAGEVGLYQQYRHKTEVAVLLSDVCFAPIERHRYWSGAVIP